MLDALDADAVRRWYRAGLSALEASKAEINSLNVFPVADADTGTNLYLTLASAAAVADEEAAGLDLAEAATEIARLCLLGARGSSGVILSQLLRGVAEVLAAERRPPRGQAVTRAFERAVELAYAAVSQPVEGTMLTVARAAAEAASADGSDDLVAVVTTACTAAREALARTPAQLDVLGRAGVVDAGGKGIVVLLDVLAAVVDDREFVLPEPVIAVPILGPRDADATSPAYEVMFLIDADDERIPALRVALDGIGDAVVVSGGDGLWNVHVHTDEPEAALAAGVAVGRPHDIRTTAIGTDDGADADQPAERRLVAVLALGSPALALRALLSRAGVHVVEAVNAASVADAFAALDGSELAVLVEASAGLEDQVLAAGAARYVIAPLEFSQVTIDSPMGLLSAVAVHDAHRPVADDIAAMARASESTRSSSVGAPGADQLVAGAVDEIERLLAVGGELVTIVSDSDVGSRVAERLAVDRPDVDVNLLTVDALGPVVWLGVE
ncbi:MAG: fatty acid kinase [Actinomycetota bacterium]|nr:fatty acid kinase [Actinomycetota bacterium]